MATHSLVQAIDSLTPEQQEAVQEFISFLKDREIAQSPFLSAIDEFIGQHPVLLSSLAK